MSRRMREIEIGTEIGRLTVLARSEDIVHANGRVRKAYLCQCSCGNIKPIQTWLLVNKGIKSCGCKQRARRLTPDEASRRQLFNQYKGNAKNRKREFSLSFEQFKELTTSRCVYCGKFPAQKYTPRAYKNTPPECLYNGIDRVDNKKDYIAENCVPCCGLCNYIKREMSKDEFISHVQTIINYYETESIT